MGNHIHLAIERSTIGSPASTRGHPEARLNLRYELHGAELTSTEGDLASSLCA
jgi:hypothetical protein